jgi:hypothetical protein
VRAREFADIILSTQLLVGEGALFGVYDLHVRAPTRIPFHRLCALSCVSNNGVAQLP